MYNLKRPIIINPIRGEISTNDNVHQSKVIILQCHCRASELEAATEVHQESSHCTAYRRYTTTTAGAHESPAYWVDATIPWQPCSVPPVEHDVPASHSAQHPTRMTSEDNRLRDVTNCWRPESLTKSCPRRVEPAYCPAPMERHQTPNSPGKRQRGPPEISPTSLVGPQQPSAPRSGNPQLTRKPAP